jgi:uroporphyrinogen decarboxylase
MEHKKEKRTLKPLIEVLEGKKPERIPVWLMRQAGRYLPEYRKLRATAGNFLDLCLNPELAAEITLQPVRRFNFDAAILFADILLVPMALGQKLEFREGEGPRLDPMDEKKLAGLSLDGKKLMPVYETLKRVKSELPDDVALIGFCGAPWTVAAYMIDGTGENNFARAKSWTREPAALAALTEMLIDASADYLSRQIEAGAGVVQVFDSWAGVLKGGDFRRWVIQPTRKLVARVRKNHPHIPIIGFPRAAGAHYRNYFRETGVDALGIDQHVGLDEAKILQKTGPLQGNLDPALLVEGGERMRAALEEIVKNLGPTHVVNLGHGVLPETPVGHVAELVRIVRGFGT